MFLVVLVRVATITYVANYLSRWMRPAQLGSLLSKRLLCERHLILLKDPRRGFLHMQNSSSPSTEAPSTNPLKFFNQFLPETSI
mmetsp:Transcript_1775/g.3389  ORF Transcript_1775/g.3389 Transcript_1775/m.3389 type:complete len:84 (+) Transcript_1775:254-505(+)